MRKKQEAGLMVFNLDQNKMEKVIRQDAEPLGEVYRKIKKYMPHPETGQGWSQVDLHKYLELSRATEKADAIVQDLRSENTPESLKAAKEIAKKVVEKMGGDESAQKLYEAMRYNFNREPLAHLIELSKSKPTTAGEKVQAKVEQVQKRVKDALSFGKKEKPS